MLSRIDCDKLNYHTYITLRLNNYTNECSKGVINNTGQTIINIF